MKKIITYILLGLCVIATSCKDDDDKYPEQPGFIQLSLKGLTTSVGESFDIYVPNDENIDRYEWTIPESLEVTEGEGTSRVTVKVVGSRGIIPLKGIAVVATNVKGESIPRYLYQLITISLPPGVLDNYKTKIYGNKAWMTENLNEVGENGDLGKYYNNNAEMGKIYGRYYTWHEAMTGIANCPPEQNPYVWGSEGVDDAGNPYKLNGTTASYNIQVRGVCPEGWHIPNIYDYYDLAVEIKQQFSIPGASLSDVANTFTGYVIGSGRDDAPFAANLTNWGFLGAYLKGSGPIAEDGLWLTNGSFEGNGKTFNYNGNAVFPKSTEYPLYMDTEIREAIEFLILPSGRWNGGTQKFEQAGQYSYHWTAHMSANERALRYTVGSGNANFSNAGETLVNAFPVRCVADY